MDAEPIKIRTRKKPRPAPRVFPGDPSAFAAAYERKLREIRAVPREALVPLNLDPHTVVATVLGTLPKVNALRSALSRLGGLNLELIDGLEEYAEAAGEANSRHVTALVPPVDIIPLCEQALKQRDTLRSDARALSKRGLIAPERFARLRGLVGYQNVGFELMEWATLLRDCWPVIQGKTALTAGELDDAQALGERLVRAAGVREQAPVVIAEAALIRQQAFTLLLRSYDEVRRGVAFLRWRESDADTIAPSLYAGRARKRADAPVTAPPAADTPAAGAPAGGAAEPTPQRETFSV